VAEPIATVAAKNKYNVRDSIGVFAAKSIDSFAIRGDIKRSFVGVKSQNLAVDQLSNDIGPTTSI
jgi:hypothetical protein